MNEDFETRIVHHFNIRRFSLLKSESNFDCLWRLHSQVQHWVLALAHIYKPFLGYHRCCHALNGFIDFQRFCIEHLAYCSLTSTAAGNSTNEQHLYCRLNASKPARVPEFVQLQCKRMMSCCIQAAVRHLPLQQHRARAHLL